MCFAVFKAWKVKRAVLPIAFYFAVWADIPLGNPEEEVRIYRSLNKPLWQLTAPLREGWAKSFVL